MAVIAREGRGPKLYGMGAILAAQWAAWEISCDFTVMRIAPGAGAAHGSGGSYGLGAMVAAGYVGELSAARRVELGVTAGIRLDTHSGPPAYVGTFGLDGQPDIRQLDAGLL